MPVRSTKSSASLPAGPDAIGIREFRSKLPEYVTGTRTVEVQRYGKPVAVIVPVHQVHTPEERQALLYAASEAFERVRVTLNLNEDELAALVSGTVSDGKVD